MKPKTPANTKALQAWQSELRHLEQRLIEWQSQLTERQHLLEEQETAFESALDNADDEVVERYASTWQDAHDDADLFIDENGDVSEDCGCDDSAAGGGCRCPKCQNTRANWVGGTDFAKFHNLHPADPDVMPFRPKSKGDELPWLEKLWKLEDKRKKK